MDALVELTAFGYTFGDGDGVGLKKEAGYVVVVDTQYYGCCAVVTFGHGGVEYDR